MGNTLQPLPIEANYGVAPSDWGRHLRDAGAARMRDMATSRPDSLLARPATAARPLRARHRPPHLERCLYRQTVRFRCSIFVFAAARSSSQASSQGARPGASRCGAQARHGRHAGQHAARRPHRLLERTGRPRRGALTVGHARNSAGTVADWHRIHPGVPRDEPFAQRLAGP